MWLDDSRRETSNVNYYKRKLEDAERAARWATNHICELEGEISDLKHRPWWKWIWNDIKPKKKYNHNHYLKEYRLKKFLGNVFRVSLAVAYALGVFGLWWKLNL